MAFEILVHLLANIAYIDLFLRMSLIVIYVIISRKKDSNKQFKLTARRECLNYLPFYTNYKR